MPLYAFDGTWNDSRSPGRDTRGDTNVFHFYRLYDEAGGKHYLDGVGSRYGFVGKFIGGIAGAGSKTRVDEHFKTLQKNFRAGKTTIDIVGYSRGATIARMFVHRLANEFHKIKDTSNAALTEPPAVRFLGLFDTVASLGIPWMEYEHDFVPTIPEFVERTFHAMALDEIRETFGIERCVGLRDNVCEVWFRGGHGDIGGNATYETPAGETFANRARSNIALQWMIRKARDLGVPVTEDGLEPTDNNARATPELDRVPIGEVGTLSRRVHVGDLVHYTVDGDSAVEGENGTRLRRIEVPTRIEDRELEKSSTVHPWRSIVLPERELVPEDAAPRLIELSSRRNPFDVAPARTWRAWLERLGLSEDGFESRLNVFWAPTPADQALAWDMYIELQTRIATQALPAGSGDEATALKSVADLFQLWRDAMHRHGTGCANVATLLNRYLNDRIRPFTSTWHRVAQQGQLDSNQQQNQCEKFRKALEDTQKILKELAAILASVADANIASDPAPED